jgi:hypothetical protein
VKPKLLAVLILAAVPAFAGTITMSAEAWEGASPWSPCNSQFGISVSFFGACGDSGPNAYNARASVNFNNVLQAPGQLPINMAFLSGFSESGFIQTEAPPPGPPARSNDAEVKTMASETENLVVLGGSGPGLLNLTFLFNGQSGNDASYGGGGGVDYSFNITGGGGFCPTINSGVFACGDGYFVYASIPFTFGTPFTVTQSLDVIAGSYDQGVANFDITTVLYGYSILDGNNPVPGAWVTQDYDPIPTPEPTSMFLMGVGLIAPLLNKVARRY